MPVALRLRRNGLGGWLRSRWLWLASLCALLLRLWLIWRPEQFWYDEAFSVLTARLPLGRLLASTAGDVHPPAYYVLLAGWGRVFGWSEIAARSLSLVLAVCAMALFWRVLQALELPEDVRNVAYVIALFLPGQVYFSTEARMYALLQLLILAALWALLAGRGVLGGLALGLAALTHNVGLFYAVIVAAVVLVRGGRRSIRVVAIAAGIGVLVWLPWLPELLSQVRATNAGYWLWSPTVATPFYMFYNALLYFRFIGDLERAAPVSMMLIGAVSCAAVWAVVHHRRWDLLILALGPLALLYTVAALGGPNGLLHRGLVPSTLFVAVLWAWLICRADLGRLVGGLVAVMLVAASVSFVVVGRNSAGYEFMHWFDGECSTIYAASATALPLSLYYDDVVYAPTSNTIRYSLSERTQTALGLRRATVDELSIDGLCMVSVLSPMSSAGEADYARDLAARYGSELLYADVSRSMGVQVWRLSILN